MPYSVEEREQKDRPYYDEGIWDRKNVSRKSLNHTENNATNDEDRARTRLSKKDNPPYFSNNISTKPPVGNSDVSRFSSAVDRNTVNSRTRHFENSPSPYRSLRTNNNSAAKIETRSRSYSDGTRNNVSKEQLSSRHQMETPKAQKISNSETRSGKTTLEDLERYRKRMLGQNNNKNMIMTNSDKKNFSANKGSKRNQNSDESQTKNRTVLAQKSESLKSLSKTDGYKINRTKEQKIIELSPTSQNSMAHVKGSFQNALVTGYVSKKNENVHTNKGENGSVLSTKAIEIPLSNEEVQKHIQNFNSMNNLEINLKEFEHNTKPGNLSFPLEVFKSFLIHPGDTQVPAQEFLDISQNHSPNRREKRKRSPTPKLESVKSLHENEHFSTALQVGTVGESMSKSMQMSNIFSHLEDGDKKLVRNIPGLKLNSAQTFDFQSNFDESQLVKPINKVSISENQASAPSVPCTNGGDGDWGNIDKPNNSNESGEARGKTLKSHSHESVVGKVDSCSIAYKANCFAKSKKGYCCIGKAQCGCKGPGLGCKRGRYCYKKTRGGFFHNLRQAVGSQLASIAFCKPQDWSFPDKMDLYIPDHGVGCFLNISEGSEGANTLFDDGYSDDDTLKDINSQSIGKSDKGKRHGKSGTKSAKEKSRGKKTKEKTRKAAYCESGDDFDCESLCKDNESEPSEECMDEMEEMDEECSYGSDERRNDDGDTKKKQKELCVYKMNAKIKYPCNVMALNVKEDRKCRSKDGENGRVCYDVEAICKGDGKRKSPRVTKSKKPKDFKDFEDECDRYCSESLCNEYKETARNLRSSKNKKINDDYKERYKGTRRNDYTESMSECSEEDGEEATKSCSKYSESGSEECSMSSGLSCSDDDEDMSRQRERNRSDIGLRRNGDSDYEHHKSKSKRASSKNAKKCYDVCITFSDTGRYNCSSGKNKRNNRYELYNDYAKSRQMNKRDCGCKDKKNRRASYTEEDNLSYNSSFYSKHREDDVSYRYQEETSKLNRSSRQENGCKKHTKAQKGILSSPDSHRKSTEERHMMHSATSKERKRVKDREKERENDNFRNCKKNNLKNRKDLDFYDKDFTENCDTTRQDISDSLQLFTENKDYFSLEEINQSILDETNKSVPQTKHNLLEIKEKKIGLDLKNYKKTEDKILVKGSERGDFKTSKSKDMKKYSKSADDKLYSMESNFPYKNNDQDSNIIHSRRKSKSKNSNMQKVKQANKINSNDNDGLSEDNTKEPKKAKTISPFADNKFESDAFLTQCEERSSKKSKILKRNENTYLENSRHEKIHEDDIDKKFKIGSAALNNMVPKSKFMKNLLKNQKGLPLKSAKESKSKVKERYFRDFRNSTEKSQSNSRKTLRYYDSIPADIDTFCQIITPNLPSKYTDKANLTDREFKKELLIPASDYVTKTSTDEINKTAAVCFSSEHLLSEISKQKSGPFNEEESKGNSYVNTSNEHLNNKKENDNFSNYNENADKKLDLKDRELIVNEVCSKNNSSSSQNIDRTSSISDVYSSLPYQVFGNENANHYSSANDLQTTRSESCLTRSCDNEKHIHRVKSLNSLLEINYDVFKDNSFPDCLYSSMADNLVKMSLLISPKQFEILEDEEKLLTDSCKKKTMNDLNQLMNKNAKKAFIDNQHNFEATLCTKSLKPEHFKNINYNTQNTTNIVFQLPNQVVFNDESCDKNCSRKTKDSSDKSTRVPFQMSPNYPPTVHLDEIKTSTKISSKKISPKKHHKVEFVDPEISEEIDNCKGYNKTDNTKTPGSTEVSPQNTETISLLSDFIEEDVVKISSNKFYDQKTKMSLNTNIKCSQLNAVSSHNVFEQIPDQTEDALSDISEATTSAGISALLPTTWKKEEETCNFNQTNTFANSRHDIILHNFNKIQTDNAYNVEECTHGDASISCMSSSYFPLDVEGYTLPKKSWFRSEKSIKEAQNQNKGLSLSKGKGIIDNLHFTVSTEEESILDKSSNKQIDSADKKARGDTLLEAQADSENNLDSKTDKLIYSQELDSKAGLLKKQSKKKIVKRKPKLQQSKSISSSKTSPQISRANSVLNRTVTAKVSTFRKKNPTDKKTTLKKKNKKKVVKKISQAQQTQTETNNADTFPTNSLIHSDISVDFKSEIALKVHKEKRETFTHSGVSQLAMGYTHLSKKPSREEDDSLAQLEGCFDHSHAEFPKESTVEKKNIENESDPDTSAEPNSTSNEERCTALPKETDLESSEEELTPKIQEINDVEKSPSKLDLSKEFNDHGSKTMGKIEKATSPIQTIASSIRHGLATILGAAIQQPIEVEERNKSCGQGAEAETVDTMVSPRENSSISIGSPVHYRLDSYVLSPAEESVAENRLPPIEEEFTGNESSSSGKSKAHALQKSTDDSNISNDSYKSDPKLRDDQNLGKNEKMKRGDRRKKQSPETIYKESASIGDSVDGPEFEAKNRAYNKIMGEKIMHKIDYNPSHSLSDTTLLPKEKGVYLNQKKSKRNTTKESLNELTSAFQKTAPAILSIPTSVINFFRSNTNDEMAMTSTNSNRAVNSYNSNGKSSQKIMLTKSLWTPSTKQNKLSPVQEQSDTACFTKTAEDLITSNHKEKSVTFSSNQPKTNETLYFAQQFRFTKSLNANISGNQVNDSKYKTENKDKPSYDSYKYRENTKFGQQSFDKYTGKINSNIPYSVGLASTNNNMASNSNLSQQNFSSYSSKYYEGYESNPMFTKYSSQPLTGASNSRLTRSSYSYYPYRSDFQPESRYSLQNSFSPGDILSRSKSLELQSLLRRTQSQKRFYSINSDYRKFEWETLGRNRNESANNAKNGSTSSTSSGETSSGFEEGCARNSEKCSKTHMTAKEMGKLAAVNIYSGFVKQNSVSRRHESKCEKNAVGEFGPCVRNKEYVNDVGRFQYQQHEDMSHSNAAFGSEMSSIATQNTNSSGNMFQVGSRVQCRGESSERDVVDKNEADRFFRKGLDAREIDCDPEKLNEEVEDGQLECGLDCACGSMIRLDPPHSRFMPGVAGSLYMPDMSGSGQPGVAYCCNQNQYFAESNRICSYCKEPDDSQDQQDCSQFCNDHKEFDQTKLSNQTLFTHWYDELGVDDRLQETEFLMIDDHERRKAYNDTKWRKSLSEDDASDSGSGCSDLYMNNARQVLRSKQSDKSSKSCSEYENDSHIESETEDEGEDDEDDDESHGEEEMGAEKIGAGDSWESGESYLAGHINHLVLDNRVKLKDKNVSIVNDDNQNFFRRGDEELNLTQNKQNEKSKSNTYQGKDKICLSDKMHTDAGHQKVKKFSVDQIQVPTIEKERVRFACDDNGEWAEIGRGSYGCVYLGLLDGSVEVAIKDFYESNSYDMVIHEARMLLFLQDTGIIPRFFGLRRRFDATKDPPEFCIIMEYFGDGRTLFNVMSDKISLCCDEWLDILGQLVAGLGLIHRKDVLINDLKADNILIDLNSARKTIRYIDVGMATYKHGLTFQLPQGQMGKYNFLAPEVREGERTSTKSDIYSLGYLLDQMVQLAGCTLEGLVELVASCMDEKPECRPDIDDIISQVHRFIASRTVVGTCCVQKDIMVAKSI